MISSALSSDSDDVTKLLNVSLDLITYDKNKKDRSDGITKPAAFSSMATGGFSGGLSDAKDGAGVGDSERAVEVLSFLVSKTKVRMRYLVTVQSGA